MSVYYNWNVTKKKEKDKKHHPSSQLSGSAPPRGGLHPEPAIIVDRRGTSAENAQKEDSPGDSLTPHPHRDPALSAKVTLEV
jgi:hypothetical protein